MIVEINTKLSKKQLSTFASLKQKKYRNIEDNILIEGFLPVLEAIRSDYVITDLLYTPYIKDKQGFEEIIDYESRHFEIDGSTLKKISSEVTPQGIVAIADKKLFTLADIKGSLLVADRIQDPGNLGTLVRIAHWFGLGGLVMTGDTVDIYNPKALRSSKGSLFHLPHYQINSAKEIKSAFPDHRILVTDVHGGQAVGEFSGILENFILVIGNESHGVSEEWRDFGAEILTLPALGGAESLNAAVAASAILGRILY